MSRAVSPDAVAFPFPRLRPLVLLVLVAGLGAVTLSPVAVLAALAVIGTWALVGPLQALQAMTLTVLLKLLNPELVHFPAGTGALFWLVLLLAMIRVLPLQRASHWRVLLPVWLFSLLVLAGSLGVSRALDVSVMKAMSFGLVISTVLVAFLRLREAALQAMASWLFTVVVFVAAASLVTVAFPGIGFALNGKGLQGILNQPQSLGVVLAPAAAALASHVFRSRGALRPGVVLLLAMICTAMFLSQARTAAIAASAGTLVSLLPWAQARIRGRQMQYAGRVLVVAAVLAVSLVAFEASTGKLIPAVQAFVLKRKATDVEAALLSSRGQGAISQFENFLAKPVTGNGFGVYPDGRFPVEVVRFAGLPISAAVEKGFLPTAILEESGVVGAAALLFLLVTLARSAMRTPAAPYAAAFFGALLVNVGEASLLAPSGIGLYTWMVIGLAVRSGWPKRPRVRLDRAAFRLSPEALALPGSARPGAGG